MCFLPSPQRGEGRKTARCNGCVSQTATRWRWQHALLLLALTTALFGSKLSCPLLEPEEARYAEIPRQMLQAGSYLEPVLHGESYYHKPPLLYWLVMACYRVFGVHDWAARLVPAAVAILLVQLVYVWGRRPLGTQTALLAAAALCLCPRYVYLGRMLSLDGLLALCVTAALLAAWRALTPLSPEGRGE